MKTTPRLLLIDVSHQYYGAFADWAAEQGVEVVVCDRQTVAGYSRESVLCVYQSFQGEDIVDCACDLVSEARSVPLVILSPKITILEAARIMEAGVRDVIRIPAAVEDVLARAAARARRSISEIPDQRLIGESLAIRRTRRELCAVAALDSTVLITGETGTGKGLAASLLHELSPRSPRAYIHLDCSGLAGSLIESELFGHERGAFTGAVASRIGRFEAAAGGTLFLDEIGELSLALQAKLLRVLQDHVYERVGSNHPRVMSARIVAATNCDLESEVSAGRFRRDLFFRLNVIRVEMPPLRDRREDVPSLVQFLLRQLATRLGVGVPAVSATFLSELARHDWPGNVRELMNVLERFLVQHHAGLLDVSSPNNLIENPTNILIPASPLARKSLGSDRAEEKRFLEAELTAVGGNISRLARKLGIARSTLRYRIFVHNISRRIPPG
jgi:DNA-binding NtrC family response regulator